MPRRAEHCKKENRPTYYRNKINLAISGAAVFARRLVFKILRFLMSFIMPCASLFRSINGGMSTIYLQDRKPQNSNQILK